MSISGLALSRVSHQAFGSLEAAYVCVCIHVCAHVFLCDTAESPSASISLPLYLRHTHRFTHVPARRVQVCDRLGILGVGHSLVVSPSAPSSKLALAQGQAATSICLVNTEISKAHPSPWQKIVQARNANAMIACCLPKRRPLRQMRYFKIFKGVRDVRMMDRQWMNGESDGEKQRRDGSRLPLTVKCQRNPGDALINLFTANLPSPPPPLTEGKHAGWLHTD